MKNLRDWFPAIEPYDAGLLPVSDGHQIYWECCGNSAGKPALYLHGGPGTGCSPGARRIFDPKVYRAVIFDQRGSGRSRPLASDPNADLRTNTTHDLIEDIERLRIFLKIERWVIFGGSWGTTLALAYAQKHRKRVEALVLAAVTTTSRSEVVWITQDVGRLFPQQWDRFSAAVAPELRDLPIVDAYAAMLFDKDPLVCAHAAREWCSWEDAHVSLNPYHQPNSHFRDPEFALRFSRLVTHYWRNAAFLGEDQLIKNASLLDGIPGVLIHGRYDVSSPLETAWRLSETWKTSSLEIIEDAGHGGGETFQTTTLAALERFSK